MAQLHAGLPVYCGEVSRTYLVPSLQGWSGAGSRGRCGCRFCSVLAGCASSHGWTQIPSADSFLEVGPGCPPLPPKSIPPPHGILRDLSWYPGPLSATFAAWRSPWKSSALSAATRCGTRAAAAAASSKRCRAAWAPSRGFGTCRRGRRFLGGSQKSGSV